MIAATPPPIMTSDSIRQLSAGQALVIVGQPGAGRDELPRGAEAAGQAAPARITKDRKAGE